MLAPQVDLAEAVLRHARRLQQHLVERRVLALGNVLQRLRRESVSRRAESRLDLLARHISRCETTSISIVDSALSGAGSAARTAVRLANRQSAANRPA